MNKLLIALGLATTVALVGCSKEKQSETGTTTGERLENTVDQAGHDISKETEYAASETKAAAEHAEARAEAAAEKAKEAAKEATASVEGSIEKDAAKVREKAEN